jgi:hypothetical protein
MAVPGPPWDVSAERKTGFMPPSPFVTRNPAKRALVSESSSAKDIRTPILRTRSVQLRPRRDRPSRRQALDTRGCPNDKLNVHLPHICPFRIRFQVLRSGGDNAALEATR